MQKALPSPGKIARKILGPAFVPVGKLYRSIFVDLDRIALALDEHLPTGAHCLEIGGGDGALADRVLARRADLNVTLADLALDVGSFISPANLPKVRLKPGASIEDLIASGLRCDVVIIAFVLHHVEVAARASFWSAVRELQRTSGFRKLVVVDIEPKGARATLSVLSDRYITGDHGVSLIPMERMVATILETSPGLRIEDIQTMQPDPPNYCVVATWAGPCGDLPETPPGA